MEKCNDPKWATDQFTEEEAKTMFSDADWKTWTPEDIVKFQLFQKRLCMPFDVFHEAIEKVLDRPVFTHEFAYRDEMVKEFLGEKPPPTLEDIIHLIPEEKRIIITT